MPGPAGEVTSGKLGMGCPGWYSLHEVISDMDSFTSNKIRVSLQRAVRFLNFDSDESRWIFWFFQNLSTNSIIMVTEKPFGVTL